MNGEPKNTCGVSAEAHASTSDTAAERDHCSADVLDAHQRMLEAMAKKRSWKIRAAVFVVAVCALPAVFVVGGVGWTVAVVYLTALVLFGVVPLWVIKAFIDVEREERREAKERSAASEHTDGEPDQTDGSSTASMLDTAAQTPTASGDES